MLSEALLIAIGLAVEAQASKPACNAGTRGLMWPLEANRDSRLAIQLSKSGSLEICMRGPWRYHWTAPAVHIKQLEKRSKDKTGD